jgi:cell division protein FtsQ
MAHNAALRVSGHIGENDEVREETIQMLKRIMIVVAMLIVSVFVVNKREALLSAVDHPVSTIKVSGAFSYLQEGDVTQKLNGLIGQGFMATDLKSVQARVEELAWVHSATVSRVWPGEIKLVITEQVAVSHWNQGSLLNAEGVVFTPSALSTDLDSLPLLIGSEQFSASKKTMMFTTLNALQLGLQEYGLDIERLELKPRNVWNMTLANGIDVAMGEIKLNEKDGEQTINAKLERVGKVFSARASLDTQNILRIDARYPNGVAIKWRAPKN